MSMPAMHKSKYYVLQADCVLQENFPKIEVIYKFIPSNYHTIMGDERSNEISDIAVPKIDDKFSYGSDDASEYAFESDNDDDSIDSAKVAKAMASGGVDIIDKHGMAMTGRIMM